MSISNLAGVVVSDADTLPLTPSLPLPTEKRMPVGLGAHAQKRTLVAPAATGRPPDGPGLVGSVKRLYGLSQATHAHWPHTACGSLAVAQVPFEKFQVQ